MKSGIVRRIDELGRIVLPAELRRSLKINEGDNLLFSCIEDGILLSKYSYLSTDPVNCDRAARAVHDALGLPTIVFDDDRIVASAGLHPSPLGQEVTDGMKAAVAKRRTSYVPLDLQIGEHRFVRAVISPLLSAGDLYGGIAVLGADENMLSTVDACSSFLRDYLC